MAQERHFATNHSHFLKNVYNLRQTDLSVAIDIDSILNEFVAHRPGEVLD